MARPEEKAQAMLNKWVKMREDESSNLSGAIHPTKDKRRPFLASQCEHLHDAEHWRRQIIREISSGISKIQNPGMGEHAIRDLNDSINKLMREKYHWNRRIVELGGVNYNETERRERVQEGDVQDGGSGLKGSGGYRYFGAAKDLPGVKELFARNAAKLTQKRRGDLYKYITPDYYGLRDEEDGVLLELEEEASKQRKIEIERMRLEYRQNKSKKRKLNEANRDGKEGLAEEDILDYETEEEEDEEGWGGGIMGAQDALKAHVAVPTQEIVAKTMLEQKKKELLDRLVM